MYQIRLRVRKFGVEKLMAYVKKKGEMAGRREFVSAATTGLKWLM